MDVKEYIWYKGLVEQTLKLIAGIAKWFDIFDLKTGLLLANIQAVKHIIEGKTFYLHQLFLTLQNKQNCKEDPVLSQELFVEKFYNARVYLNLGKEICASWSIFSIFVKFDKANLEQSNASGKKEEVGNNGLVITRIGTAFFITSIATLPKMSFFGNTLCDNQ